MTTILPFVATVWLLAMLPGVGQALMLRQTLEHGRTAAWATIAGTSSGLVVWSTLAAAGLSAVLLTNAVAYDLLRWTGGLVLVVLGMQSWRSAGRRHEPVGAADRGAHPPAGGGCAGPQSRRRAFAAGLLVNLGNPKAGVFAVALLPQFAPATGPVLLATVGLGVVWAVVTGAWYVLFVGVVHRFRALVTRSATQRVLARVTAVVLVGLGAAVVLGV